MNNELITTGVQRIKATYGNDEIVFRIDFDHPEAKKTIKEMARHWVHHIAENASFEDLLESWIQIASLNSYRIYCDSQIGVGEYLSSTAGFCPMDGSKGISIYRCSFYAPEHQDFKVSMYDED